MRHRPVKSLDAKIAALGHLLLMPERDENCHPARETNPHPERTPHHPERTPRHPERPPRHPERPPRHPERTPRHPERSEGSSSHPGRWYEREAPRYIIPEDFSGSPVYVEFGCGKGDFINALSQSPEAIRTGALAIGIEGGGSIVLAAMRKTDEAGISNVRYIKSYVNDATMAFAENSLDGIFLNFSDPWPKDRHADRRLTSPSKAAAYLSVIKPGGFAVMKTDGKALYEYSLETFRDAGFDLIYQTTNLKTDASEEIKKTIPHISEMALSGVTTQTEYERKFRGYGYPIYCFIAIRNA